MPNLVCDYAFKFVRLKHFHNSLSYGNRRVIVFDAGVDADRVMEAALEAGAEDIVENDDGSLEVLTAPEDFERVRDALADAGLAPAHAETTMRPSTDAPLTGDDAATQVSLPFPFTYYGQTYSSVLVATNGHMNFLASNTSFSNSAIPSTTAPNGAIYPFWDDLVVDASSSVRTEVRVAPRATRLSTRYSLPLGISTGNIIVQIKSSSGTYDRDTGDFTTHDEYEISFTNDLSFFGFTSPVIIPSKSEGNLNGGPSNARTIGMTWEGQGELENSEDPSNPFKYTYVCTSTTKIADPATFPPLPEVNSSACGAGLCGVTGLLPMLAFAFGLAMMKVNVARRRTRR